MCLPAYLATHPVVSVCDVIASPPSVQPSPDQWAKTIHTSSRFCDPTVTHYFRGALAMLVVRIIQCSGSYCCILYGDVGLTSPRRLPLHSLCNPSIFVASSDVIILDGKYFILYPMFSQDRSATLATAVTQPGSNALFATAFYVVDLTENLKDVTYFPIKIV